MFIQRVTSEESSLIVEVVTIDKIEDHPNADRLDLATIKGWQCVVQKGAFASGDKAIYIPIDSILPAEVESKIFGPDSKVKLSKSRVKTIKLRGAISQGLVTTLEQVGLPPFLPVGTDIKDKLKIGKWEPSVKAQNALAGGKKTTNKNPHPSFHKYTKLQNVKNYIKLFEEGELVVVTEKIHGTNFRAGYVPFQANTLWKKVKKFFGYTQSFEFAYGSHNVQLQNKFLYDGFYDKNVYAEVVEKYHLRERLKDGEVVYGEIYGSGVQKNYSYGCAEGERKLAIFDVMKNEEYLGREDFDDWVDITHIPRVPMLYHGPFDFQKIKDLLKGNSIIAPTQKVIEGGVCRPAHGDEKSYAGRKVLKFINDDYLLKDQSDFH